MLSHHFTRASVLLIALAGLAASVTGLRAAERVTVVVGPQAEPLERLAAEQLAAQWQRLFDAAVTITADAPPAAGTVVLLGVPARHPRLRAALGERPAADEQQPGAGEQAFEIRGFRQGDQAGLAIAGGSPVATLWAVYELGHQFGVRYLLREDIYPDQAPLPKLDKLVLARQPVFPSRAWETFTDLPIGSSSWPLEDQRRLLGQLAKLKFSRVVLRAQPWQPLVHYECRGIARRTALLWTGGPLETPRDMPGWTALRADEFRNPDFAAATGYEQQMAAGQRYAQGVMDEAHRLGMSFALALRPLEFTAEFSSLLPRAEVARGMDGLLIAPGPRQDWTDPALRELVLAQIQAALQTWPQLDALVLEVPDSLPRSFWNELSKDLEPLRKRSSGTQVELVVATANPELPQPSGGLTLGASGGWNLVEPAADDPRALAERLARMPTKEVPCSLTLKLADDDVGILSQASARRLEAVLGVLREQSWQGYTLRGRMLAELDPTVDYVARAAWQPDLTARRAHDELLATITGKPAVSDRLWLAFGHIEQANAIIRRQGPAFGTPASGLLMKHYQPQAAPEWWDELNQEYTQAMVELYRAHDAAEPRSRPLLFYWAKRSEYVLEYLACVKAVRQAALAGKEGQRDQAGEQFETALEQLYNAMDTLSDVVRDPSDRGLIALLYAYAYRPLLEQYEQDAQDE
ncbi:MAG: hypothetical protein J5I93_00455 [Pirellulaceae bacterium]|nr:hypothetical protein [Pirellulaceae bacterium]